MSHRDWYDDLVQSVTVASFRGALKGLRLSLVAGARGRRYWYCYGGEGATQRPLYIGPEGASYLNWITSPNVASAIEDLCPTLSPRYGPQSNASLPSRRLQEIAASLADAGVFRLRGILIGTMAYQTYQAMLGIDLPESTTITHDVDIAQFSTVSHAVADQTPALLDVLRQVEPSFRAIPSMYKNKRIAYVSAAGTRVEFFCPNRGPDSDVPVFLPALGTHARPLRFLDYLIYIYSPAVLLYKAGIFVLVPPPERFAVHKLILSSLRESETKRAKDLLQAQTLLDFLTAERRCTLRAAWLDAAARGKAWRRHLAVGLQLLPCRTRTAVLNAIER